MADKPYFKAIDDEMNSGGREALLRYLLNFDLTGIDLRTIPKTDALLEQKIASLNHVQAWWMDVLTRGELPPAYGEAAGVCGTIELFNSYINHAQKQGVRRRAIETEIGIFFKKYVPELKRRRRRTTNENDKVKDREYVYAFPSLATCRTIFAEKLQQDIAWPKMKGWARAQTDMYGRLL